MNVHQNTTIPKMETRGENVDIKTIVLDMDGTLLKQNGMVEENVIIKLKVLREQGMKIFVTTDRTQKELTDILPVHLDLNGYVTANGMVFYMKEYS